MNDYRPGFRDRRDAGRQLARRLERFRATGALVLALPRGGVPVAFEVAVALDLPLDVVVVRKLGLPGHPELAIGAIASGAVRVVNEDMVRTLNVPQDIIETVAAAEELELRRREAAYRGNRPPARIGGRTCILIDDGLATGSTMLAAARAVRERGASRLVIAVPVATPEACSDAYAVAEEVICVLTPQPFFAVGVWYQSFPQLGDEEVTRLLRLAPMEQREHAHDRGA